ncbi:hypothetical protein MTO96_028378 [Rhipicephalus appendiculatus]
MPLAPRHGTAPWEALLGRLVLCAALCVCRGSGSGSGELPPPAAEPPVSFAPFRSSARCNASCSAGAAAAAASCASPPARLPFCTHLPMRRLLLDAGSCHADRLERALRADQLACLVACEFRALLNRFDCLGGYSAKWNCHTCAVSMVCFYYYAMPPCVTVHPTAWLLGASGVATDKMLDRGTPAVSRGRNELSFVDVARQRERARNAKRRRPRLDLSTLLPLLACARAATAVACLVAARKCEPPCVLTVFPLSRFKRSLTIPKWGRSGSRPRFVVRFGALIAKPVRGREALTVCPPPANPKTRFRSASRAYVHRQRRGRTGMNGLTENVVLQSRRKRRERGLLTIVR